MCIRDSSNGATVQGSKLPDIITWTGTTFHLGVDVTYGVLMMLLLYVVVAFALGRTAWGRHVYAVGDDAEAARLSGIRVNRVLLSVYVVAGAIVALAAWIQIGRDFGSSPNAAVDANLNAITAVVIGGTSLFGGTGSIFGTVVGTVLIGVLLNGLQLNNVSSYIQQIIIGLIIVLAVAFDTFAKSRRRVG